MTGIATTTPVISRPRRRLRALPGPAICGVAVGVIQAASPLGFWGWPATA